MGTYTLYNNIRHNNNESKLLICDKDPYVIYHLSSHNNLNILMSSKLSASEQTSFNFCLYVNYDLIF